MHFEKQESVMNHNSYVRATECFRFIHCPQWILNADSTQSAGKSASKR